MFRTALVTGIHGWRSDGLDAPGNVAQEFNDVELSALEQETLGDVLAHLNLNVVSQTVEAR